MRLRGPDAERRQEALAGDYLVAEVEDDLAGLFFVIVPIVGSVTNWYRFAKMP